MLTDELSLWPRPCAFFTKGYITTGSTAITAIAGYSIENLSFSREKIRMRPEITSSETLHGALFGKEVAPRCATFSKMTIHRSFAQSPYSTMYWHLDRICSIWYKSDLKSIFLDKRFNGSQAVIYREKFYQLILNS